MTLTEKLMEGVPLNGAERLYLISLIDSAAIAELHAELTDDRFAAILWGAHGH